MSRRAPLAAALIVSLAAATSACGNGGADTTPSPADASAGPRPSSTARLAIVSPRNGQIVRGSDVRLEVSLEGAVLVDATTTDLRPDQGHLHVLLDETLVSMTSGLDQLLPDLEPGRHLIRVEFVANDHAPFDPRVIEAVSFEVRP
jgi:hypothetical protein